MTVLRSLALVLLLLLPQMAQAHLLPKQHATLRVKENAAYVVFTLPVSALSGVDQDRDGLLSPQEVSEGNAAIQRQFAERFAVSDGKETGTPVLTMIALPHGEMSLEASDYLVVMHTVGFAAPPRDPVITTDLFGTGQGEGAFELRITVGDRVETTTMQALVPALSLANDPMPSKPVQTPWYAWLALVLAGGGLGLFFARRRLAA